MEMDMVLQTASDRLLIGERERGFARLTLFVPRCGYSWRLPTARHGFRTESGEEEQIC
ncbi:MAG: hypothetical protein IJC98_08900 [Clostridia bacterium]|nr:hypothetical protein [Clostridia bacterium]